MPRCASNRLLTFLVLLAVASSCGILCPPNAPADPNCCYPCQKPIDMVWPTRSRDLADHYLDAHCEGGSGKPDTSMHYGIDLYSQEGNPVYAAFNGTVYRFNESYHMPSSPSFNPTAYSVGCGLMLLSTDGQHAAIYGHLQEYAMANTGEEVEIGEILGYSGGGQENIQCRGTSPGSRLYFELWEKKGAVWRNTDPYSCVPDTCKFWYIDITTGKQCIPDKDKPNCRIMVHPSTGEYRYPSYSCESPMRDRLYYADIMVNEYGRLNLSCINTSTTHRRCMSEIYDSNIQPLLASGLTPRDRLNCFLRFIRIHNDGSYSCGKIIDPGPASDAYVDWTAGDCSEYTNLRILGVTDSSNDAYRLLHQIEGGNFSVHMEYVVVGGEYEVIGVDDSDLIMKQRTIPDFHPGLVPYHVDYILVRDCDMFGLKKISFKCKTDKFYSIRDKRSYEQRVLDSDRQPCTWGVMDAGKFYDEPYLYFEVFDFSRLASERGKLIQEVYDPVERVNKKQEFEVKDELLQYNKDAMERMLGCDECNPGDLACTLGASRHALYGECGYMWEDADYYGYNDLDERKAVQNAHYKRYDGEYDTKGDYESGKPDEGLLEPALKTVVSNMSGYFVKKVEWRGPPFWLHIDNPGPGGSRDFGDTIDWKRWLMPCAEVSSYDCKWECCRQRNWVTCANATPPCDSGCSNRGGTCQRETGMTSQPISTCSGLGSGTDWSNWDTSCWRCTPVGPSGNALPNYCGWGGVEIKDEVFYKDVFYFYDKDTPPGSPDTYATYRSPQGYDCNDDVGPQNWPGMPAVLGDQDLVKDRYWKHNSSSTVFHCTRPGYCAGESAGSECIGGTSRDGYDRPSSKQHDPCRPCEDDADVCPEECYTYDLRYYRQFNIDSLWGKVFKLSPEVNYMLTPDIKVPDTHPNCTSKYPGKYKCRKLNIGEGDCDCDDQDGPCSQQCLDGLDCVDVAWSLTEYCCPEGTYYRNGCCRFEHSEECITQQLQCPKNDRVQDSNGNDIYLLGIGEGGCEKDAECAEYKTAYGDLTQHCSDDKTSFITVGRATPLYLLGHCCPTGYEYDRTYQCCLPKDQSVKYLEMHEWRNIMDEIPPYPFVVKMYCEEKIEETGNKCSLGEGGCRTKDRLGLPIEECEPGLVCKQSTDSANKRETGCCLPWQEWNGKGCYPVQNETPWYASWTRSGGPGGGGPITIHAGGGLTIPNGSEAAGWGYECDSDPRFMGWDPGRDGCRGEICRYCDGAVPYRCPPSPIWFEARNFGDRYRIGGPMLTCNGPFDGQDGTVHPYKAMYHPVELECDEYNCNCGRDMYGIGDVEDGVTDDGPGCMTGESTACRRGTIPGPAHKCNIASDGHSGFPCGVSCLTSDVTVDPDDGIIPAPCGRMQRKEVVTKGGYYPKSSSQNPETWFDLTVYEWDEQNNSLGNTTYLKQERNNNNMLEGPAAPAVVLKELEKEHTLSEQTRYVKIDLNFTGHNEIWRKPTVKQCIWLGCSRREQVVIEYTRTTTQWDEDGNIESVTTETHTSGTPPNCCGGWKWGGCSCGEDPKCRYYDDCTCEDYCWGCWHMHGRTDHYPVTKPDSLGEEKVVYENATEFAVVRATPYGVINETKYLRVENSIQSSNSESVMTVKGKIIYTSNDSGKISYTHGYLNFQSLDAESVEDETNKSLVLDMLGGFRLDFYDYGRDVIWSSNPPPVAFLTFHSKMFAASHDMTALESTLPRDYILLNPALNDILDINLTSGKKRRTSMLGRWVYDNVAFQDPRYVRWLVNPIKKYYYFHDWMNAFSTKYNLNGPLFMYDRAEPEVTNWLDEPSANIGLYRNFHEDEPRYYDFASIYYIPQNPEEGIAEVNYDPSIISNTPAIAQLKPIETAYVRYAPYCDHPHYKGISRSCSGQPPDMCTEYAEVYCRGGQWDCRYKDQYRNIFPQENESCIGLTRWKTSELFRCEGRPSKYKSFCADGKYWAYWFDYFQYKYKWDAGNKRCDIRWAKECEPIMVEPQSYTLFFETASLSPDEWGSGTLRMDNNLRYIEVNPFGGGSCGPTEHNVNIGGLSLNVKRPHPADYDALVSVPTSGTSATITFIGRDLCGGGTVNCNRLYAEFSYPYAHKTGWYSTGSSVTVDISSGIKPVITVWCYDLWE